MEKNTEGSIGCSSTSFTIKVDQHPKLPNFPIDFEKYVLGILLNILDNESMPNDRNRGQMHRETTLFVL